MAIVTTDNKHYKAIADKVREIKGTTETMTPSEMPEKVQSVYNTGYEQGKAEGDSWYDTFWGSFQENGARTQYQHAFRGMGWTNETFKPKYSIGTTSPSSYGYAMDYCFYGSQIKGDLVEILADCGVTFDFSECYNITQMFRQSKFTRLGNLEFTRNQNSSLNYMFDGCTYLETIDLLTLRDGLVTFSNAFTGCVALKNISFAGGLIQSDISFADSPNLTRTSVQNIINHLMTITDGKARTVTFHADVKAKLTDEQIIKITGTIEQGGKGWTLA